MTTKRSTAAKKAAVTRKRKAAGKKAAQTKKRRVAGRKAAATRKKQKEQMSAPLGTEAEYAENDERLRHDQERKNDVTGDLDPYLDEP
jgi:hypothetical protein